MSAPVPVVSAVHVLVTMASGKACPIAGCGFVTDIQVPEDAERQKKLEWVKLQMEELRNHTAGAHNAGGGPDRPTRSKGTAKMDAQTIKLGVDKQSMDCLFTDCGYSTTTQVPDETEFSIKEKVLY